jgi:Chaperone of endosialidase
MSSTCGVRLKKNVESLAGSLDILTKLRPVSFEWITPGEHGSKPGQRVKGLIAQDVEKVMPDAIGLSDSGFKTVDFSGLQFMLIDSVRTLKVENDSLRARVDDLEKSRKPFLGTLGNSGGMGLMGLVLGAVLVGSRKRRVAEGS